MTNPEVLIEKIKGLPPQQQTEVEDFVEFLAHKDDRNFAKIATMSSEKSFANVWDNNEDSVYDELCIRGRCAGAVSVYRSILVEEAPVCCC